MTININLFFPTRRKYEMKAPTDVFSTETDQGLNHLPSCQESLLRVSLRGWKKSRKMIREKIILTQPDRKKVGVCHG